MLGMKPAPPQMNGYVTAARALTAATGGIAAGLAATAVTAGPVRRAAGQVLGGAVVLPGLQMPRPVAGLNVPTRPTTEMAVAFTAGTANATDWSSDATMTKHGMTVLVRTHWLPSTFVVAGTAGTAVTAGVIEPARINGVGGTAAVVVAGTAGTAGMNGENRVASTAGTAALIEPARIAGVPAVAGILAGGTAATALTAGVPGLPATPWSSVRARLAVRVVLCRYTPGTAATAGAAGVGGIVNGLATTAAFAATAGVTSTSAPKVDVTGRRVGFVAGLAIPPAGAQ